MAMRLVLVLCLLLAASGETDTYVGGSSVKVVDETATEPAAQAQPASTASPVVSSKTPRTVTADPAEYSGGVIEVQYVGVANPTIPAPAPAVIPPPIAIAPVFNQPPPPELGPPPATGGYGGRMAGDVKRTMQVWAYNNGTDVPFPMALPPRPQSKHTQPPASHSAPVTGDQGSMSLFTETRPLAQSAPIETVYGGAVEPLSAVVQPGWFDPNSTNTTNSTNATEPGRPVDIPSTYEGLEYGGPVAERRVDVDGHCVSWGHPQSFRTFDNSKFTFQGMGEFVMYAAVDNSEQVNLLMERDGRLSFNTGVAFRTGLDILTVTLEKTAEGPSVAVRLNGKGVSTSATAEDIGGYSILQEGRLRDARRLTIAMRNSNDTKLAVAFYERSGVFHANVFLQVTGSMFDKTKGLCGLYNWDSSDDMRTPDGDVVTDSAQLGTAWAVQHPKSSWQNFLPDKEPFVATEALNSFALASSENAFQAARVLCNAAHNTPKQWREMCRMNVLQGGHLAGREEVNDILKIARDGRIKVSNPECLKSSFRLGRWGQFGNCTSVCSSGFRERIRYIYTKAGVCGTVSQKINCQGRCGHAKVTATCAVWGLTHISTFDQTMFNYHGAGEYTMYHDPNAREQVNILLYRPRKDSSATLVSGVALRLGEDVYSIQLAHPLYDSYSQGWNRGEGLFSVAQEGSAGQIGHTTTLTVLGRSGTSVVVTYAKSSGISHFNVYVKVHGQHISTEGIGYTQGLCGVWDFDRSNDFMDNEGRIGRDPSVTSWSYRVRPVNSLFIREVPVALSPPMVEVSISELNPTPAARREARVVCKGAMRTKLKPLCKLDVAFMGVDAASDSFWARRNIGRYELKVTGRAAACLREPGSKVGPFSNFTEICSKPCGGGFRTKFQTVVNAAGAVCGELVVGKPCNERKCPVDCVLSPWTEWSACNNTCGNGFRSRRRTIDINPAFGGAACPAQIETEPCSEFAGCCVVGNWSSWGRCANGQHERNREVNMPQCGHNKEIRPCCELSRWSDWSDCNNGSTRRNRFLNGDPVTCKNFEAQQSRPCCSTGEWNDWGPCIGGYRARSRTAVGACDLYAKNETQECCTLYDWSRWSECIGGYRVRNRVTLGRCEHYNNTEKQPCCYVGKWQPWSQCTNGAQTREREVIGDANACSTMPRVQKKDCCVIHPWSEWTQCINGTRYHRRQLEGSARVCGRHAAERTRACCDVGEWSGWGQCEGGLETRVRYVNGDATLCSRTPPIEQRPCCRVGAWRSWTKCEDGQQTRQRELVGHSSACDLYDGSQNRSCCTLTPWSDWSACENGTVARQRSILGNATMCDRYKLEQKKPCCHVHDWSDWGECFEGSYNRTRLLTGDESFCKHWKAIEKKPCCDVSAWSDWTDCKANVRTRFRNVIGSSLHCGTLQTNTSERCCETGPWSGWTECSKDGTQRRQRFVGALPECSNVKPTETQPCCNVGPWDKWSPCLNDTQWRQRTVSGHEGCETEHNSIEYRTCGALTCRPGPWGDWGSCTGGIRARERLVYGPSTCTVTVPLVEKEACNETAKKTPCTVSEWSDWTSCSGGKQERHRILMGDCGGEFKPVQNSACQHCMVGPWTSFGACWDRKRVRTRVVDGQCPRNFSSIQSVPCYERCVVSNWGEWGQCSTEGVQIRSRNVTGDCASVEAVSAENRTCCVTEPWTEWTNCSADGFRSRSRRVFGAEECLNQTDNHDHEREPCCEAEPWSDWQYTPGYRTRSRAVTPAPHCGHLAREEKEEFCHVGAWGQWQACDAGERIRTRYVDESANCASKYPNKQTQPCCVVGEWSDFTPCAGLPSATKSRTRPVTNSAACLRLFPSSETQTCSVEELAFCDISKWSPWTECDASGKQMRTRSIGNQACAPHVPANETQPCCIVGAWSEWDDCKEGQETRRRNLTTSEYCSNAFPNFETRACTCSIGLWSDWSECNPVLATQTRHRDVIGNQECLTGNARIESRSCCEATPWSAWTQCDVASGQQSRQRSVSPDSAPCHLEFPVNETRACCNVEDWSPFTECAFSKDNYKRHRVRSVTGDASCAITYKAFDEELCCKVGKWQKWSQCKNGKKVSRRKLRGDKAVCKSVQLKRVKRCCSAGNWTEWGKCTPAGHQHSTRKVFGSRACHVKLQSVRTRPCCFVGKWNKWGKCKKSNMRFRKRKVVGDATCVAANAARQKQDCKTKKITDLPAVSNTPTPVVPHALPVTAPARPATPVVVPSTSTSAPQRKLQVELTNKRTPQIDAAHSTFTVQPDYLVTPEQPRFAEAEATSIDFAARIRDAAREDRDA